MDGLALREKVGVLSARGLRGGEELAGGGDAAGGEGDGDGGWGRGGGWEGEAEGGAQGAGGRGQRERLQLARPCCGYSGARSIAGGGFYEWTRWDDAGRQFVQRGGLTRAVSAPLASTPCILRSRVSSTTSEASGFSRTTRSCGVQE